MRMCVADGRTGRREAELRRPLGSGEAQQRCKVRRHHAGVRDSCALRICQTALRHNLSRLGLNKASSSNDLWLRDVHCLGLLCTLMLCDVRASHVVLSSHSPNAAGNVAKCVELPRNAQFGRIYHQAVQCVAQFLEPPVEAWVIVCGMAPRDFIR